MSLLSKLFGKEGAQSQSGKAFAKKTATFAEEAVDRPTKMSREMASGTGQKETSMNLPDRIWELLRSKDVDGLRACVRQEGNSVTETLVAALDMEVDSQVKGIAVDALGLTSDPRALNVLLGVFENSTGGFKGVAALAISNIVANRVREPSAIPTLITIARDSGFADMVRQQAILALIYFRKNFPEADAALKLISNDADVDFNLRFLAA